MGVAAKLCLTIMVTVLRLVHTQPIGRVATVETMHSGDVQTSRVS